MENFNETVCYWIRHFGFNPEHVGAYVEMGAILMFVVTVLWFIFPWLPDEPERGWGPKNKQRAKK